MSIYYHININMNSVKEIDVKNCTYCFRNGMISIENLDPNKIKIAENHTKALLFTTLDM